MISLFSVVLSVQFEMEVNTFIEGEDPTNNLLCVVLNGFVQDGMLMVTRSAQEAACKLMS